MTVARVVQETSLLTWIEIQPITGERQVAVYNALLELKQATDQEIARHIMARDPNVVRPRRKELYDMGVIRAVAKRPCTITGKTVLAWEVIKKV